MQQTIRQAMILAAGKGTRLRPLTLHTPKPLIKVGDKPLIVWHIEALKKVGIVDIAINTAWLSEKLISALGDGSDYGVNLHWSIEDKPLETAGGIATALHRQKLKPEPFILINGDIWTNYDFNQLKKYQLNDKLAHLLLIDNPSHNPNGDFVLYQGLAKEYTKDKALKYTFSGISVLSPELFNNVTPHQESPLAPLLKQAMVKSQVSAEHIDSFWVDVGTPKRLEFINNWLSGHIVD